MEQQSILQQLLTDDQWDCFQPLMERIRQWNDWPRFEAALSALKRESLYASRVHGEGHIERTMLHGAFCAMEEGLAWDDTALLLDACAYHDVGRVNDWYDVEHGHRSAQKLGALTGRSGQELVMLMAAVDAHSRPDREMENTLHAYAPEDYARTVRLAQMLKDADGLDRVRIHDLKTEFLRRPASAQRADFALYLYAKYELYTALRLPFQNNQLPAAQIPPLTKQEAHP
ncbi:MAG: hypothetical protein LUD79_05365 [Oscillospiraceae bacterium]|nr:hypothetical protein [Oscillospiraceae bacterium]